MALKRMWIVVNVGYKILQVSKFNTKFKDNTALIKDGCLRLRDSMILTAEKSVKY